MNLSFHAMRTVQSNLIAPSRIDQPVASLRDQACLEPQHSHQPRRGFCERLGLLAALALALTCGVTRAQTLVASVPAGLAPDAVAVNQTTNMIYVTDANLKTLAIINGATNAATTIPAGGPFAGVAVNSTTNTIYALNGGSQTSGLGGTVITPGSVVVVNGATSAVTTTIALPALASHILINPVTNKIYVSTLSQIGNGAAVNVTVIDGATNTITATISIPQLIGSMAVDTARNVIYAMYENAPGNADLAEINGATNTITATVQVGFNDLIFSLNQTTNTIYVPDAHGNQVYVIDGATGSITTTIPWPDSLISIAPGINPTTNTIYLAGTNGGSYVVRPLDGSTNSIGAAIADPAFPSGGFLVNTVTNKIWQLSSPDVVIDGATKTATSITGTSGSAGSEYGALNTVTNYAYIAEPNNVFVISGAPAGPAFSASPSPLAFGNQTQGTTSSASTLTVTNSGTANLAITTVTLGGTNLSDFIIGADTCANATVAAKATCTVSVQFEPSTASGETATLTFTDNASDSPETVNLTGNGVAPVATSTTTKLSASLTSFAVGTSVTFTATVTPTAGTPTPTGTVTFKDGAITLGTGTLNGSGLATYSTSSLAVASHSVTASYAGDARNTASTSPAVTVSVTLGSTTTAITASAASIAVGSSITFTATVTGTSGVPASTGAVTFMNGVTTLGTGTLNGSGVATYTAAALAAGSYNVTANYAGDTNNASSTSSAVAVTVWPGPPAFTLTLSPSTGTFHAGSPAVVTVTVLSVNGFNSATSLTCGSLPRNTTCTFSSSSITPAIAGTATSTLTIATDTSAKTAALESFPQRPIPTRSPIKGPIAIAGVLAAFFLFPFFGAANRKTRRLLLTMIGAILLSLIASIGMSGCGSSAPTTPNGNYSIQVNAAAGSLTQSATYSLTLQ